jgi:MYXO-CTERM domain-containing protein
MRRILAPVAAFAFATLAATAASAGLISDENSKSGFGGSWPVSNDGTARFDGVVDVYPAEWSIARGTAIKLKIRSTTTYDVRVLRLGWYAGQGAREVTKVEGQAASPQPYPVADEKYGLAEAKWSDSVTIPTDASWTPGLYVARVEQQGGKQALTFFVIRDDGLDKKMPILLVVGTATHQSYNAWPGPDRGGKSLYGFNSSPAHPTDSIGTLTQAVRVSFDRPYFVGGGTADVGGYEYPFLRWAERNGYEIAYATDLDIHRDPDLMKGRRAVVFSGHEEYVSWEMYDNAIAARDSGTNFLFLSGDTWSWQVRFEPGSGGPLSTVIGYKESWVKDPEQREAFRLRQAGQIDEAKKHFRRVTRGWKNLEFDEARGIDERRPGITLTGVQSSGIIRDAAGQPMHGGLYPWADLIVDNSKHWIFQGTGLKAGDKIPNVFGYEVDSTMRGTADFDKFRPAGQQKLGTIKQVSDGTPKGAAGYYQKDLGSGKRVEVVSMAAIYFAWALDDFGARGASISPLNEAAGTMMKNVFARWTGDAPIPPVDAPADDAGVDPGGNYDPEDAGTGTTPDGGIAPNDPANPNNGGAAVTSEDSGGCSVGARGTDRVAFALGGLALAALLRRRRSTNARG